MSYYREISGRRGRALNPSGPEPPDTSGMTQTAKDKALNDYKNARKKDHDSNLAKEAKFKRFLEQSSAESNSDDGVE